MKKPRFEIEKGVWHTIDKEGQTAYFATFNTFGGDWHGEGGGYDTFDEAVEYLNRVQRKEGLADKDCEFIGYKEKPEQLLLF